MPQIADNYEPSWFEQIWMMYNDAFFIPFWVPQLIIYGDTPRRSFDIETGFFKRVKEKKGTFRKLKRNQNQSFSVIAIDASEIQEEYTVEEFQDYLENIGFDSEDFDLSSAEKLGIEEDDYQILLNKGYFSVQSE